MNIKNLAKVSLILLACTHINSYAFFGDDKARQSIIELSNKTQSQYQKLFEQQNIHNQSLLSLQQDLNRNQQQIQELRGMIEQTNNQLEQRQNSWNKLSKHFDKIDKIDNIEQNQKQISERLLQLEAQLQSLKNSANSENTSNPVNLDNTKTLNPALNSTSTSAEPTSAELPINSKTNLANNMGMGGAIELNNANNTNISNTTNNSNNSNNLNNSNTNDYPKINIETNIQNNTQSNVKPPAVILNNNLNSNKEVDALYQSAFAAIKKRDFKTAEKNLKTISRDYAKEEQAKIAPYYLGNTYYLMKSYKLALVELAQFIKNNPEHPKVPDAYLSIASIQMQDGQNKTAQNTLNYIVKRFPNNEAASIAKERLDKIR